MPDDAALSPVVFLSHASEDKDAVVRPIALELAQLGVTPWLDEWEILPGDSLVRKLFDEGVERADAVVIFISYSSVTKPWVREELDAAAVKRIREGTRLIAVRLDGAEVPAPLKHLVWIDAAGMDPKAIAQIIANTVLGHDARPAIADPAPYARVVPSVPGLTSADQSVLQIIVEEAIHQAHLMLVPPQAVLERSQGLGLTEEMLAESLTALEQRGYITFEAYPPLQIYRLDLLEVGYGHGLPLVVSDHEDVAKRVIAAIVNNQDELSQSHHAVDFLAEKADAPHLLVRQVLIQLDRESYLSYDEFLGSEPGIVAGNNRVGGLQPTLRRMLD